MSHAATAPYQPALPADAEDKKYPLHGYPYAPPMTGVTPWVSSAQQMVSEYPLCEGTPPPDMNMMGYGEGLLNYEPLLQNTMPNIFTLPPDDSIPLNFNDPPTNPAPATTTLPYMESPNSNSNSAEDNDSTKNGLPGSDTKFPPPHPLPNYPPNPAIPKPDPDLPPHMNMPMHISIPMNPPMTMAMMPPRSRRHSAPDLSQHEHERQLKHASRRASHNIVEKRYRINLNSKFRKLEEVVLKGTEPYSSSSSRNATTGAGLQGQGNGGTPRSAASTAANVAASSAHRQQSPKASIIDSALSYIESLQSENHVLRGKLDLMESSSGPTSTSESGFRRGNGVNGVNGLGCQKESVSQTQK